MADLNNKYKPDAADKFIGFFFDTKLRFALSFIGWSIIYKIIDMNTLQWFGKDIFIRDGNILEFIVCSVGIFCIIFFPIGYLVEWFRKGR